MILVHKKKPVQGFSVNKPCATFTTVHRKGSTSAHSVQENISNENIQYTKNNYLTLNSFFADK